MNKTLLLSLALMLCGGIASAQTTVTGSVVDSKGNPMPGAKVQVKGTEISTITNMDGTFTINTNKPNAKLQSDYVGWLTKVKTAKDGVVIKMYKDHSFTPTQYQWFIGANVAVPTIQCHMAPGIMFGRVKNVGWYVKGQANDLGFGGTNHQWVGSWNEPWKTGKTKVVYRAAMLGGLARIPKTPLYLYAGAGYAKRIVKDELVCGGYRDRIYDDKYEDYNENYYEGYILDLGYKLRIKNFFIHAGVQGELSHGAEYAAGNFGIGYIF